MSIKTSPPYAIQLNRLFILKYLTLLPTNTQLEMEHITYPRQALPFSYVMQLGKKLGIKIDKAGIGNDPDSRSRYYGLLGKLHEDSTSLHDKALDFKLTKQELDDILSRALENEFSLYSDLAQNLSLIADWEKHKDKLQEELANQIEPYIKGQNLKHGPDYRANVYSYKYQKNNFLKNISGYADKYGLSFTLKELSDAEILGEDTAKISFLPSLIALESQEVIKIDELEVHDPEIYNLESDQSDLVAMITVNESKIQKDESLQIASKTKSIVCGKLSYDLDKCQLKYGNKTETITPESREIKFLRSLYNRAGMVVKYKDIARDANLQGYKYYHEDCGESHEEINNQALSDDVAMLRRDFRSLVLSLGMPNSEFKRLITNVTKRGYMLNL